MAPLGMSDSFSSILTAIGDDLSISIFSSSSPYLLNSLTGDICFTSCGFGFGSVVAADIAEPATPSAVELTPNFKASRREYLFSKGISSSHKFPGNAITASPFHRAT
jgi:hypothetical protein